MKANRAAHSFTYLLSIMAGAFRNPLEVAPISAGQARHEFHLLFGENPIFTPRGRKLKGYMKQESRKKGYHKFQKH